LCSSGGRHAGPDREWHDARDGKAVGHVWLTVRSCFLPQLAYLVCPHDEMLQEKEARKAETKRKRAAFRELLERST
jgi:hypothetical protein